MDWNQSTMYEQRVRFILEVHPPGSSRVDDYIIYDIYWSVNEDKLLIWLSGEVKTEP